MDIKVFDIQTKINDPKFDQKNHGFPIEMSGKDVTVKYMQSSKFRYPILVDGSTKSGKYFYNNLYLIKRSLFI